MTPYFTVVICTHNRAQLLPRAMQCVLDQTFDDFELLVVDDGSTDGTRDVVAGSNDPRVRYLHRAQGGLSAARNSGVDAARGRIIAFLDDDDRVVPDWLEQFASVINGDQCVVVSCGVKLVDEHGHVLKQNLPHDLGPAFDGFRGLFQAGTFAVTRDAYIAVGGFAEGLPTSHQSEFSLRLLPMCRARGWRVGTVDEYMLLQTHRKPEERERNAPERLLAACDYILEQHGEVLARSPELLANYYALGGVAAARLGSYPRARELLRAAVRSSEMPAIRRRNRLRLALAYVPPLGNVVWRSRAFKVEDTPEPQPTTEVV